MFVNLSGLFWTDYESMLKRGLLVFLKHFCKDRRVVNCIDLREYGFEQGFAEEYRKDPGISGVNGLSVK